MENDYSRYKRPKPIKSTIINIEAPSLVEKNTYPNKKMVLGNNYEYSREMQIATASNQKQKNNKNSDSAVFMCGTCNSILGDSISYIGIDKEMGILILSSISEYVTIDEDTFIENDSLKKGWQVLNVFKNLICSECNHTLGNTYISTNTSLDSLRNLFCFKFDRIKKYILGQNSQKTAMFETNQEIPTTLELQEVLLKTQEGLVQVTERLLALEQDFEKLTLTLEKDGSIH
ncbi:hypothetical protein BB558_005406 [Smittium angustum]|uniref:Mis18 domain-containing protein n=1 Tax=Smittium angustum TaxID=133377 RepID=A0A2U1J0T9_SMIAN|nr:hypothetical protein BB558_005406 [Smittium angustum]